MITKTHSIPSIASWAGVSLDYVLELIRLGVIDLPDCGREYSDSMARRVVTTLKTRRQRLLDDIWERELKKPMNSRSQPEKLSTS